MSDLLRPPRLQVVYVLTTSGDDIYADMTLVSALSVRHTNPGCRIDVVCDRPTFDLINAVKHPLLGESDKITPVLTPDGEPTFRNRWMKTQVGLFVKGPVLFLDSDTLICESLSELINIVTEFGAVANHNAGDLHSQIWEEDLNNLRVLNWYVDYECYINGGVWFYGNSQKATEFFRTWHSLWRFGYERTGRLRDQPSLNTAIYQSGISANFLPATYNRQLNCCHWRNGVDARAKIWHFYTNSSMMGTSFERLTNSVRSISLPRLRRDVASAIACAAPWPNSDFVSRLLSKRIANQGAISHPARLWLNGARGRAVRSLFARN
jgi:hypothetical protein